MTKVCNFGCKKGRLLDVCEGTSVTEVNEVILEYLIVAIFEADGERRPSGGESRTQTGNYSSCSTRLSSRGVANVRVVG